MNKLSRRRFFATGALPFGISAGLSGQRAEANDALGHADMVVTGANIVTMDSAMPSAEALAVRGDRFLAVGSDEDILDLAGAGTTRIDGRGMTITPGFIDAHSHPLFAEEAVGVNVNLRRIDDVKAALAQKAANTVPGHWVRGVMYDDTKFEDERALNRHDIDDAVPDHPVYVGPSRWAYGRGQLDGIRDLRVSTAETPDPDGGRYFRENGELTGKGGRTRSGRHSSKSAPGRSWIVRCAQRAATISSRNMAAVRFDVDHGCVWKLRRHGRLPGRTRRGRALLPPVVHARRQQRGL